MKPNDLTLNELTMANIFFLKNTMKMSSGHSQNKKVVYHSENWKM